MQERPRQVYLFIRTLCKNEIPLDTKPLHSRILHTFNGGVLLFQNLLSGNALGWLAFGRHLLLPPTKQKCVRKLSAHLSVDLIPRFLVSYVQKLEREAIRRYLESNPTLMPSPHPLSPPSSAPSSPPFSRLPTPNAASHPLIQQFKQFPETDDHGSPSTHFIHIPKISENLPVS